MKSKELLKLIKSKRDEARGMMDTGDMTGAKKIAEELRGLEDDLETALTIEGSELRDLRANGTVIPVGGKDEERQFTKEDELRSIGKHILGLPLNDEERGLVTVADNGALLPQGYVNDVMLLRDGYPSLKKFVHVIPVTTKTGKMPVAQLGSNKLAKLSSDQPIDTGAANTKPVNYDVADYGKFVPIERSLTDDEVVGIIENILLVDFAEGSVEIENEEIIGIIEANKKDVTGTSHEDVEKAIDTLVPAARAGAITITNTAGFTYLKNKKDKIGRPLNLITYVNGQAMFNNKPIIEVSDDIIAPNGEKFTYYVANLKEAVKFFDRKGIEITKSTEFLFNKNQDCLRAIERFDAKLGDARSCKKVVITPVAEVVAAFSDNGITDLEVKDIEV